MALADLAAAADAAAAPKVHLALLAARQSRRLPVPTSGELDLLLQLEGITLDDNTQLQPLTADEAQQLDNEFNALTLSATSPEEACAPLRAAVAIQARVRGHQVRLALQLTAALAAAHEIQQAAFKYVSRSRVSLLAPYLSLDNGPSSSNPHMRSVRLTTATKETKAASSARQAKARRQRATEAELINNWAAAIRAQTGMLPWTARLVGSLFAKMQPAPDFAATQCASLRCAIVSRLSVIETERWHDAKVICNAVKMQIYEFEPESHTDLARVLGAYLKDTTKLGCLALVKGDHYQYHDRGDHFFYDDHPAFTAIINRECNDRAAKGAELYQLLGWQRDDLGVWREPWGAKGQALRRRRRRPRD